MKLDLEKSGLNMAFKPHEILALDVMWNHGPLDTGDVWRLSNRALKPELRRSRATYIFFLQKMARKGLFQVEYVTDKGGHKGIYTLALSPVELAKRLALSVDRKMTRLIHQMECYERGLKNG